MYLYQMDRILYDSWILWDVRHSDSILNLEDFEYVLQEADMKQRIPPHQNSYYMCRNTSEMISIYYMCDGHNHCQLGDDEYGCIHVCHNSSQVEDFTTLCYLCKNDKYIPMTLLNNGVSDCPLGDDETNLADKQHIVNLPEVPVNECSYQFRCRDYYCVPWTYLCNGKYDCPLLDDEIDCSTKSCSNLFHCKDSLMCIHVNDMCNGKADCIYGEDELLCDLPPCPKQCSCLQYAMSCASAKS